MINKLYKRNNKSLLISLLKDLRDLYGQGHFQYVLSRLIFRDLRQNNNVFYFNFQHHLKITWIFSKSY